MACSRLLGLGVPDAHEQHQAQKCEGDQEHRPEGPVAAGDVAQGQRLHASSEVHEAVDDAHRRGCTLASAEVHRGRAREQTVRSDDADGDQEDQAAQDPAVFQERDHAQRCCEGRAVEEACGGCATRLEQLVADHAREDSADDAGDHQHEAPVVDDVFPALQVASLDVLLGEDPAPVHDAVAQHSGAEFHTGDDEDDAVGEDLPDDLEGGGLDLVFAAGGVAGVEVLESGFRGLVLEQKRFNDEERAQEDGRCVEDPGRVRRHHGSFSGHELQDPFRDIEGEEEAGRDHDAEDSREGSPLPDMEPVCIDLHDAHGAVALEVHVDAVDDREDSGQGFVLGVRRGQHVAGVESHGQIGQAGTHGSNEHAALAADLVGDGSVDQEGQRVDPGTDTEDGAEVCLAHQVAHGALADGEVVAPHVEQRVGQTQRQPVNGPPDPEVGRVHDGLPFPILGFFSVFLQAVPHGISMRIYLTNILFF